ncbi:Sensor kinase GacS [gamma proteobacterium HdN1]|nr:Sensor kinase GacS [gamma proteobacterium HdN1]
MPTLPRSLNHKNLLWSLLPSLVFSVVLGGYFFGLRIVDLNSQLEDNATVLAQAYALAAHEALTSHVVSFDQERKSDEKAHATTDASLPAKRGNSQLQAICDYILEHHNVRAVAIFDGNGQMLARTGPFMLSLPSEDEQPTPNQPLLRYTSDSLRVATAIENPPRKGAPTSPSPLTSGWLEIEIEPASIVIEKYRTALLILLGIFLVISLNAFVALRFSRYIHDVIEYAREAIARMVNGDIETEVLVTRDINTRDLFNNLELLRNTILQGQKELQHHADQTTEDLRETLETIEIQNIELDLARKEAVEASRIKSEFLANISHEIRTPLNAVIGFTTLLLKSDIKTFQYDYLETILKSSEGLLAIINDVLDFSKIEAGKLSLESTPFNFQNLVEDVLTMLAPMAYEKHLEQISLYYSDVPQQIIGDPLRLKQILTNLVNNAIKFTSQGEVVVRVMLEDSRNHLCVIKVSVTDTGIGLTKEQQSALFHAFQQADNSAARRHSGTGLGLVISKHLVEQMRGQIGIESEIGAGATFWFTFRAEIVEHQDSARREKNWLQHVAIYDNNSTLRMALRSQLESLETRVTELNDLSKVSAFIEKNPPDVLIIGINPERPQYRDILHIIKTARTQTRALLLGNPHDRQILHEMCSETELPLFISKPIASQKLFNCLHSLRTSTPAALLATHPHEYAPPFILDHTLSVIVVDDNQANLKLLTTLLESLGITVSPCESGERALTLMNSIRYDLVFMDIQMPVMDGIETTHRIRQIEDAGRHVPIIAVTAHALASEKRHLLDSGLDDYVTKPISEAQILHIIKKWTGVDVSQISKARLVDPQEPVDRQEPVDPQAPADSQELLPLQRFKRGSAVDMALGIQLANGKEALAEEMFSMLTASLAQEVVELKSYWENRQFEDLLAAVHKLHGATRYTGVPYLQQAARLVEEKLKTKSYSIIEPLFHQLIAEIQRVLAWSDTHSSDMHSSDMHSSDTHSSETRSSDMNNTD